jgi:FMN-dependent dehydrogenase
MRENLAAFDRWTILPNYLSGHASADPTTTILGTQLSYPVITAPMGNQGLVHAQKGGSHRQAAAGDGPKWFDDGYVTDRCIYQPPLTRNHAELDRDDESNGDLPDFDIMVSHGVLSWISPDNRRHLVGAVAKRLKPGGLVDLSCRDRVDLDDAGADADAGRCKPGAVRCGGARRAGFRRPAARRSSAERHDGIRRRGDDLRRHGTGGL